MAKELLPTFFGKVSGGKLSLRSPDKFKEYLSGLEDKDIVLVVKKEEYNRTLAENRYYHGVIVKMVSKEMAIIPSAAHEFLKSLFLKIGVEIKGKRFEMVGSTADLSIGEFEDYCEKIRNWAADELDLYIPLPNEISLDDL